jgi:hypothetical protein
LPVSIARAADLPEGRERPDPRELLETADDLRLCHSALLRNAGRRRFETRLDGKTLVVRIPIRLQRRGGRKRIVAPDGSEIVPTSKPQPDGTLVKALARAWRWQRMLDEGTTPQSARSAMQRAFQRAM